MKRYKVYRWIELPAPGRWKSAGSRDAESPEEAVRKIAYNTGIPAEQLTAREVLPLRTPGGKP